MPKIPIAEKDLQFDLNVEPDIILDNIRANLPRDLPQLRVSALQDRGIALVGGGPSLADQIDDIKRLREEHNYAVVATNGTHDYLRDAGVFVSMATCVDAREHNARFYQRPIEHCRYVIASQCHPAVFDALRGYDVTMFHATHSAAEYELLLDYFFGAHWVQVPGGSTVVLRALSLLDILGFRRFELFGVDSCCVGDAHHAYTQAENDGGQMLEVEIAGRTFLCQTWMWSQAREFQMIAATIGKRWQIVVHGDGLLAWIVKTAATEATVEEVKQ